MNKKDYEADQHIFYCDKSDWYEEDENGKKVWDKEKCAAFWQLVREEKMREKDYNFSEFVFPEFLEENFWLTEEERVFDGKIDFTNVQFSDSADFRNVQFSDSAYFSYAKFSDNANFSYAKFSGYAYFWDAKFSDFADFMNAQFSDSADFMNAKFSDNAYFIDAQFSGYAYFWDAKFSDNANFRNAKFSDNAYFRNAKFSGYAYFWDAKFSDNADFRNAKFDNRLEMAAATFQNELVFEGSHISFLKSLDTQGYNLEGAILAESHFYGIHSLENVNFKHSFLLSLNLANKKLLNCDFTGAMISGLITRGWQPNAATEQNTKYIYTDFTVVNELQENGETRKKYKAVENSRVPTAGEFGVGENEGFTLKDYLYDPIKWSHGLNLPQEIRTGFLNYIKFFEDYLLTTEDVEIEIRTKREGGKVRVEFATDDPEKKAFIQEQFGHYIENIKKAPNHLEIDFSRSKSDRYAQNIMASEYKYMLAGLQIKLENTLIQLKEKERNIELLEENRTLLKKEVNYLKNLKENPLTVLPSLKTNTNQEKPSCDALKLELSKKPEKVIQQLEALPLTGELLDELIRYTSQYNKLKRDERHNTRNNDNLNQQYAHCINAFLDLLTELKEEGILE